MRELESQFKDMKEFYSKMREDKGEEEGLKKAKEFHNRKIMAKWFKSLRIRIAKVKRVSGFIQFKRLR